MKFLSKYFEPWEVFVSKQFPELAKKMKPTPLQELALMYHFVSIMDPIRKRFGITNINSGLRSEELNKAIGGHQTSDHLQGSACDFTCENEKSVIVFNWIVHVSTLAYRQVIHMPEKNAIHIASNIPSKPYKHEVRLLRNGKYILLKNGR